jgi:hypothetical protein
MRKGIVSVTFTANQRCQRVSRSFLEVPVGTARVGRGRQLGAAAQLCSGGASYGGGGDVGVEREGGGAGERRRGRGIDFISLLKMEKSLPLYL